MQAKQKITGISITGIVLLALGTLLLLDNLDLIYFDLVDFIGDWWPAILILVGVNEILKGNHSGGWFLTGLGGIILLKINDIIDGHFILAAILILAGIILLLRPRRYINPSPNVSGPNTEKINLKAIFAESHEKITSDNFQGGDIEVVFGKISADLSGLQMSPGRRRLNVETIFGQAILQIPGGVRVEVEGSPVFGHINNQTGMVPKDEDKAILESHAEVMFGSLQIRN